MDSFISKFTDYILLNAYSVQFAGLCNGKSGIALCLFEVARYFHHEDLENKAFELLQESLVLSNKSNGMDFENGLTGVGFALLFLIEYQFIDADFEELFGEQLRKILLHLKEKDSFSEKDVQFMFFLALLIHSFQTKEHVNLMNRMMKDVGNSLEKQLNTFDSNHYERGKFEILNRFDTYLKVAYCANHNVQQSLKNRYIELYKQGKIASQYAVGYYLKQRIASGRDNAVFDSMKENSLQNIHPDTLTLGQRIDLLYLITQADEKQYEEKVHCLEKDLFDWDNPLYEKNIIQSIPDSLIAGYGSGIARLLLYWVYRENKRNGQDCSRFKYLF